MKQKVLTAISTGMLVFPWTILPLRTFPWALQSPVAEILIYGYAAFMIFSGIFTWLAYAKGRARSSWMQVCAAINGIYALGGLGVIALGIWG